MHVPCCTRNNVIKVFSGRQKLVLIVCVCVDGWGVEGRGRKGRGCSAEVFMQVFLSVSGGSFLRWTIPTKKSFLPFNPAFNPLEIRIFRTN